jgi:hypothetical protein
MVETPGQVGGVDLEIIARSVQNAMSAAGSSYIYPERPLTIDSYCGVAGRYYICLTPSNEPSGSNPFLRTFFCFFWSQNIIHSGPPDFLAKNRFLPIHQ